MRLMLVVGVDGCRGGWVAIAWDTEANTLTPGIHWEFAGLLAAYPEAAAIGVDIPIGLPEGVARGADLAARRVLGLRSNSVFPAPDPRLLGAAVYADALALSRALNGKGISKQAHAIFTKIAEVNGLLTPELQTRVVEVHPEVSFGALGGHPMTHSKRTPEGFEERRVLLSKAFDQPVWDRVAARSVVRPAAADDVLDAAVAAWSAHRFATGTGGRLPEVPELDGRGLRMEIIF